jgi:hypothetical protein
MLTLWYVKKPLGFKRLKYKTTCVGDTSDVSRVLTNYKKEAGEKYHEVTVMLSLF